MGGYGAGEDDSAGDNADLAQKYRPDQPRAPAGGSDGGQWVAEGGGGGGSDEGRVVTDATPDNFWQPDSRVAQVGNQPEDRKYSVNLDEEAVYGGHTITDHVAKSDQELLAIVGRDRYQGPMVAIARIRRGAFLTKESANNFVNQTLKSDKGTVDAVASGRPEGVINGRFGYITGKEAFRPDPNAAPYMRPTYEVRVLIRHEPRSPRGYRVHTAFPFNRDPR